MSATKSNTDACIFFIGPMSDFNWLSVLSLSRQVRRVYIFSDAQRPPECLDLGNIIFARESARNIFRLLSDASGVQAAHENPYKLCDFKQFWPLVASKYHGFDLCNAVSSDVDCIYGDLSSYFSVFSDARNPVFIGDRGHIQGGNRRFYEEYVDRAREFFGSGFFEILSSRRNYAFDEFLYQNKLMGWWANSGKTRLNWRNDISSDAVDINYWSAEPKDQYARTVSGLKYQLSGARPELMATLDSQAVSRPYVHFQKREVVLTSALATLISVKTVFFNFSAAGVVLVEDDTRPMPVFPLRGRLAWLLRMLGKRVKSKIRVEAVWRP